MEIQMYLEKEIVLRIKVLWKVLLVDKLEYVSYIMSDYITISTTYTRGG